MFENCAQTKPSSKECVMKLFEGIDNKSSHSISEIVSFLEIKFQVFCLQKNFWGLISIHCEVTKKKHYVSIM